MPISHKKQFGIYHWDTFDNVSLLITERDSLQEAQDYIKKEYGDRISSNGADVVEIVNKKGDIVSRYKVT